MPSSLTVTSQSLFFVDRSAFACHTVQYLPVLTVRTVVALLGNNQSMKLQSFQAGSQEAASQLCALIAPSLQAYILNLNTFSSVG